MEIAKRLEIVQGDYRQCTGMTLTIRDSLLLLQAELMAELVDTLQKANLAYDVDEDLGPEVSSLQAKEAMKVFTDRVIDKSQVSAALSHVGPYGYGAEPYS